MSFLSVGKWHDDAWLRTQKEKEALGSIIPGKPALELPYTSGDGTVEGMNASHGSVGRDIIRERAALETYKFLRWKTLPVGRKTERETNVNRWWMGNDWWTNMITTFVERDIKRSVAANLWRSQENAQFEVIKINGSGRQY